MKLKNKSFIVLGTVLLVTCALFINISFVSGKEDYYYDFEVLDNSGFDNSTLWVVETLGDEGDVDDSIAGGAATFSIIGDDGKYNITNPNATEWSTEVNPDFPLTPNSNGTDSEGWWVSHTYDESIDQTHNFPSTNWKKDITLDDNISDYVITSANISAVINGSADTNLEILGDILVPSDNGYTGVGDFSRFYVKIADPSETESYTIAHYRTTDLGADLTGSVYRTGSGETDYLNDTYMIPIDQDLLQLYLTKVLSYDSNQFTIILGIDVYCEDNFPQYDLDEWHELRIKDVSLNLTYEKKIDQFTSTSYTQEGHMVNATTLTNASMSFDYKIDTTWPTASPNSEIRTIINDRQYSETVKLNIFDTSYQSVEFKQESLRDLFAPNQTINVTFQLFIADEFLFNDSVTISIDNVHFKVSYMVYTPDPIPEPEDPGPNYIGLSAGLAGALGAGTIALILWQAVFKYPVHVRKIRNVRRKIRRGGSTQPLKVTSRADHINSLNKSTLNIDDLKVKSPPKHL